jgi:hypothetical protein
MQSVEFTKALTDAAKNMPAPTKDEKEAIEKLLNDAFNTLSVNKTLLYAFRLGMAFLSMKNAQIRAKLKATPSNCKYTEGCKYNEIPPRENSQECIGCEGNKDKHWKLSRNKSEDQ